MRTWNRVLTLAALSLSAGLLLTPCGGGGGGGGTPPKFLTLTADKASPAALETVGEVTFTAEIDNTVAAGDFDFQFWIQEVPQDWTLAQDYGNGNTWTWTPVAVGTYRIAVWATPIDNSSESTQAIIDFEITNAPVQTLDGWASESRRVPLPATDIPMAKITTTDGYGGVALTSTSVTVTGAITAVDDIKVWWNTADDLATATQSGSQSNPAVGTAYEIPLDGAGNGSGFLFYTISIPSGQDNDYALTVSSVTGATADNIELPRTTQFAVEFVTLALDKDSPMSLDTVGTVTFTAEANGDDAGGNYDYQFWIQKAPETSWTLEQDYGNGNTWSWTPTEPGSYHIGVWAKNAGNSLDEAFASVNFDVVSFVELSADRSSPAQLSQDLTITFTAEANGDDAGGEYEYQFLFGGVTDSTLTVVRSYDAVNTWTWQPTEKGFFQIQVWAREEGSSDELQAASSMTFQIK